MSTPASERGERRRIEELLTTVGTVAGALAGLAGFVYLVGGLVMWLRFRTADLPADQGVALMSKEQLFVVGLRLMIIPLLVTGTLAALLADRATNARAQRPVRWVATVGAAILAALLIVWAFAVAGWPPELAVALEVLAVAGGIGVLVLVSGRPADRRWPALVVAGSAVAIVVLCLAVPGLRLDDVVAALCVAAGALLAMAAPAIVAAAPRPRSPRWLWLGLAGAGLLIALIVTSGPWGRVAIALGAVVIVAAVGTANALWPGRMRVNARYAHWLPQVAAVIAVGLIVPWSFASATWPIGLGLLLAVWFWQRHASARRLVRAMAAAAVVAAAVVSIGRQLDEPVQLLHATVTFKDGAVPDVEGAYVSTGGDSVYVGDQRRGTIVGIPRGEIRQVEVGPPDERAPSPSLLSRVLPGDRSFSVRPLEVWCDGERYAWTEGSRLCRTQPQLLWKTRLHYRDFDRLGAPVRVRCPRAARDVCRGWVLLESRDDYLFGPAGVPRPVVPRPVPFVVGAGKPTEVCLTLSGGQLRLLRREAGEKPVAFDAVVAHDREGETVLDRGYYGLLVGPSRVEPRPLGASDCEPRLRLTTAVSGRVATLRVSARPGARGITPWEVEGTIRFSALGADGSVRLLGRRRLVRGEAVLERTLPPGRWIVNARYTSIAGIDHPEPVERATLTTR
jgi:hypothetical protein